MKPFRILVAEDDAHILEGLETTLASEGYAVEAVADGEAALAAWSRMRPDLLILDIMMPGRNGYEVCRAVRAADARVPIIMLSAKSEEIDKVLGLQFGADDYMTKPFGIQELTARAEALLRRLHPAGRAGGVRSFGEVEFDLRGRTVTRAGQPVHLTPKELDLLEVLVRSPGRVQTRDDLLARVWGRDYEGTARTVDNFLTALRRKLEPRPEEPAHLITVRGKGYRFDP